MVTRTWQSSRNGGRTFEQLSEHVLGTPSAQSILLQHALLTTPKRAEILFVAHLLAWPKRLRRSKAAAASFLREAMPCAAEDVAVE